MQYNVSQLLKEPIGATRRYQLDEDIAGLDPLIVPTENLRGAVHMMRTGQGILVSGRLAARLETQCSRCLDTLEVDTEIEMEEEFCPTLDVVSGRRLVMEDEDQALWIDAHHILDLTEVVRQDLLLILPSHPLCREGCAGICPQCGQNRNEGPCECKPDTLDLRWTVLLEDK
jgi:uncharacterized protein